MRGAGRGQQGTGGAGNLGLGSHRPPRQLLGMWWGCGGDGRGQRQRACCRMVSDADNRWTGGYAAACRAAPWHHPSQPHGQQRAPASRLPVSRDAEGLLGLCQASQLMDYLPQQLCCTACLCVHPGRCPWFDLPPGLLLAFRHAARLLAGRAGN